MNTPTDRFVSPHSRSVDSPSPDSPSPDSPSPDSPVGADVRVTEISRLLHRSPHHELRHVGVELVDGRIVLRGTVCSYYMKQLAQETVRQLYPHHRLSNELSVR